MIKCAFHIAHISFVLFYLLLSVLHGGMRKPSCSVDNVSAAGTEQVYLFSDGFDGCLNALQPQNFTVEVIDNNQVTIRLPFFSSQTAATVADFLISSGQAGYLYQSTIFVIQPQIFDLLFPFHYYS
ncbi:hypothetical protein [Alkaliflexus imshenetskii]|uniref:hypothetical protein n=1 Tax=Alkaliflexus imshenetskii TaxID=286730 RepID=UPI00047D7178|nr:hypothetical protein [Alkaliflexus imshenetskii]